MFNRFKTVGIPFNPATDIPDLGGKVILVTGGNSGLGAESIKQLAAHNAKKIYLCARTQSTAESTVSSILSSLPEEKRQPIEILELDLGDFDSVKKCADEFLKREKRLDILLLNAGIAFESAALTKSGYELQFGTNHVGHALLTKLLMPVLLQTAKEPDADVRVVAVASRGHNLTPTGGIVFDALKDTMSSYYTFSRYGQSKLANILFVHSLATRYPPPAHNDNLTFLSVHPGPVSTGIGRDVQKAYPMLSAVASKLLAATLMVNVSVGAKNQLWACTDKGLKGREGGVYFEPVGVEGKESESGKDRELADKLWEWTEKEFVEKGFGEWP